MTQGFGRNKKISGVTVKENILLSKYLEFRICTKAEASDYFKFVYVLKAREHTSLYKTKRIILQRKYKLV